MEKEAQKKREESRENLEKDYRKISNLQDEQDRANVQAISRYEHLLGYCDKNDPLKSILEEQIEGLRQARSKSARLAEEMEETYRKQTELLDREEEQAKEEDNQGEEENNE